MTDANMRSDWVIARAGPGAPTGLGVRPPAEATLDVLSPHGRFHSLILPGFFNI